MKNILIISGHTDLAASVANKTILETLNERLPEAEIVKLDELYPDFKIDVEAEQQKLLRADIVVLQFPPFLVLRTLYIGTLDGRDFPSRFFTWQYRRQAQRQEAGSLFHNGSTRSAV